jgi:hypothetical protein
MRSSPSISPAQPDDRDVYLVLDDFGHLGRSWRETDEEDTSRQMLIADLLEGQYSNPQRVVAFNTAEGWSRDVSGEIADEIAQRCAADGFDVPRRLDAFVQRHGSGTAVATKRRG